MTLEGYLRTGLKLYMLFGGWAVLPVILLSVLSGTQETVVLIVASAVVLLTFSAVMGHDYVVDVPDHAKPPL